MLTLLNEIAANLTRPGVIDDVATALQTVADSARRLVNAGPDQASHSSALVWLYDPARQTFDPALRAGGGKLPAGWLNHPAALERLGRYVLSESRIVVTGEDCDQGDLEEKNLRPRPVCLPLIAAARPLGVLYIFLANAPSFDQLTLAALENFSHLAAMAIYNAQWTGELTQRLNRQIKNLEKLRWASQQISSRPNLQETLREILDIGLELTAAQYGSFERYDKKNNRLTIEALAGRAGATAPAPPLPVDEQSVVGWVALHRKSLLIADLRQANWRTVYKPLPTDQPMRSELAVPLIGPEGHLEGVLNIESPRPGAFSEEDQQLLEALAPHAVVALQEIRLLTIIHEFSKSIDKTPEDELLQLILDRACSLVDMPVGAIWTISGANLILRQATRPLGGRTVVPLNESLTAQALRLRRAITIDDLRAPASARGRELVTTPDLVSAILVPLLTSEETGQAIGSICLYTKYHRDFSDWDKKLLSYLADQAAIALRNSTELTRLKQLNVLSEREHEVLSLLTQGYTNQQIATALTVSVNTIKKHLQSIFTKLNVDSRAAAVAKALGEHVAPNH